MLKKTLQTQNGILYQTTIEEVPMVPSTSKKIMKRQEIQDEVFDLEDSVADNSKMISLMLTVMDRMYNTFTETQKAKMTAEDRGMIEYMFSKFKVTETRADVQFKSEGLELVDRLLDRQATIGDILKR